MNRKIIETTPFGPVAIIWTADDPQPKIVQVLLSRPGLSVEERAVGLYPHSRSSSCTLVDDLGTGIVKLFEGEAIDFSLDLVDLDLCGDFQRRVLRAEHGIPRGSVSSYGLIARHLDRPQGARAVGNALANNPFPLIVPCHRAIRSDRRLGGYQGGPAMKRALLQGEGIAFDAAGRVKSPRFHYER